MRKGRGEYGKRAKNRGVARPRPPGPMGPDSLGNFSLRWGPYGPDQREIFLARGPASPNFIIYKIIFFYDIYSNN